MSTWLTITTLVENSTSFTSHAPSVSSILLHIHSQALLYLTLTPMGRPKYLIIVSLSCTTHCTSRSQSTQFSLRHIRVLFSHDSPSPPA
eukprot:c31709_g1_i1 orf=40-306(+)